MRSFRGVRAFTLVELMIVVAIIGVLAALAIYGVTRYLRNAKTAEARAGVGAIAKGNVSYFNHEVGVTSTLTPGQSSSYSQHICAMGNAGKGVPATAPKAVKYQSSVDDWKEPAGAVGIGFPCVRFAMDQPQYFQYRYETDAVIGQSATGKVFTAFAHGDLNGDGITSTYSLSGEVGVAGEDRILLAPSIAEGDPNE